MTAEAVQDRPALVHTLLRHSAVYATARVLLGALDLVLLPLYTRVLSPDEYGLVAVGAAVLAGLALIYPLGFDTALGRFFFDHDTDSTAQRRTIGVVAVAALVAGFTFAILLTILGPGLFGDYLQGMSARFFRLLVWTAFFNLVMPLWLQLLQARREPKRYLTFSLLQAGLRAGLTLLLVVALRRGAEGWGEAYLYSSIGAAAVAGIALVRTVVVAVDGNIVRAGLGYGLPLLMHQIAGWATVYAGRLILNRLGSLGDVGVFQVAFGVGAGLGLVTTAVNFAYAPSFMAEATRSPTAAASLFGAFGTRYIAALAAVAVLIALFAREIVAVLAPSAFAPAAPLVPILVAGVVAQGFYYLLANPIFFRKSLTRYLPLVTVTGGLISILGGYLLIPTFGAAGAAWAGLIANLVITAAAYPLAQRAMPIRYDLRPAVMAVVLGAGIIGVSRVVSNDWPTVSRLLLDFALGVGYLATLVGTHVLDRDAIATVTSLMRAR